MKFLAKCVQVLERFLARYEPLFYSDDVVYQVQCMCELVFKVHFTNGVTVKISS